MELDRAYKKIFSSNNLYDNLSKINGEFKGNELVQEVTKFIEKDKKAYLFTIISIMIGLIFGETSFPKEILKKKKKELNI